MNLQENKDCFDRIKIILKRFNSSSPPKSNILEIVGQKPVSSLSVRANKELIEGSSTKRLELCKLLSSLHPDCEGLLWSIYSNVSN